MIRGSVTGLQGAWACKGVVQNGITERKAVGMELTFVFNFSLVANAIQLFRKEESKEKSLT